MAMMVPMAELDPNGRIGRELADRLEALRRAHKMTQGQLAYKTGMDKSTISQILAGARKDPPIGTVMRFAKAFDVTLDELVGLKPLLIPELPEAVEEDAARLAKLEAQVAQVPALAEQVANLAATMREYLQGQQAADKRPRSGKGKQQSA